jgi:hypothetical protein
VLFMTALALLLVRQVISGGVRCGSSRIGTLIALASLVAIVRTTPFRQTADLPVS